MRTWNILLTAACSLGAITAAPRAHAVEPWSDPDPEGPPARIALSSTPYGVGFRGAAEYRANALSIRPLDLNSTGSMTATFIPLNQVPPGVPRSSKAPTADRGASSSGGTDAGR